MVLNDQERMQHFSKELGVDGKYLLSAAGQNLR